MHFLYYLHRGENRVSKNIDNSFDNVHMYVRSILILSFHLNDIVFITTFCEVRTETASAATFISPLHSSHSWPPDMTTVITCSQKALSFICLYSGLHHRLRYFNNVTNIRSTNGQQSNGFQLFSKNHKTLWDIFL